MTQKIPGNFPVVVTGNNREDFVVRLAEKEKQFRATRQIQPQYAGRKEPSSLLLQIETRGKIAKSWIGLVDLLSIFGLNK